MTSRIYIAEREGVLQMYVDDTLTQVHPCLTIMPFCRCSKILGEAGKQEILQQMFRKF